MIECRGIVDVKFWDRKMQLKFEKQSSDKYFASNHVLCDSDTLDKKI